MEFIKVEKSLRLSVSQMNAIYNNFVFLKEKFENMGFRVGELADNSVTYSIAPIDILEKFNNVEYNIQLFQGVLNKLFFIEEKFYKKFVWEPYTMNRKDEVWRWIDWQEYMNSLSFDYEELYDREEEILKDVNGEPLMVITIKEYKNGKH